MQILAVLLAFFQAFPKAKEWFDQLLAMYIESQIDNMKSEHKDAIKKAIGKNDQRPIEQIINPGHAGQASGVDGVETFPHRDRG